VWRILGRRRTVVGCNPQDFGLVGEEAAVKWAILSLLSEKDTVDIGKPALYSANQQPMDRKSSQGGFHEPEFVTVLLALATLLLLLSAITMPLAKRLGYHPVTGVLVVVGLCALYFIYVRIQLYFRELKENKDRRPEGSGVRLREKHGLTVLDVNGSLGLDNSEILRREFAQLLDAGNKSILLNFAKLRHIDAHGLSVLSGFAIKARAMGGALKLAQPSGQVRQVLEATRLAEAIEIYSDEDQAAASFAR
jgi:anti-sigma B factor antagonist